jgi:hyaluronoglucosaminidase
LEILRFLGATRLNRYIYAPKSESWREDFTEENKQKFIQLLKTGEENFVRVVYAVRPGSSFNYSSDEDASALIRKLDEMIALGARGFAVFFDGEDQGRFKTPAAAQAALISRIHGRLKQSSPDIELYISPSVSPSSNDYLKELEAATPLDVLFLRSNAGATANRRYVVWDNFAVNDDQPWRLSLVAKPDSSPAPAETANGFFVTAMSQARASMIALVTAADYAWDTRSYNAKQSFDRALNMLYDERARAGLRVWAQNSGAIFKPLFQKQAGEIEIESAERKLAGLSAAVETIAVTLNQGLLRGELAAFIARARFAIDSLKSDPNYEKLPNGNYRLRGN